MVVPIVIFVVCFGGGAVAAAHWLPDLGTGQVAGLAFFAVCGLLGGALGLAGLHIYSLVNEMETRVLSNGEVVAAVLRNILLDAGTLFGLAAIVYLLARDSRSTSAAIEATASEIDD